MSEIILGVGGGIAAYKSCDLLRRLPDLGPTVKVVPPPASLTFVGKATWEALSGSPVYTEVWEAVDQVNHVKLGDHAEYIIIAPATADLIARLSSGRADDQSIYIMNRRIAQFKNETMPLILSRCTFSKTYASGSPTASSL